MARLIPSPGFWHLPAPSAGAIVGLIVGIAGLGGAGYLGYQRFNPPPATAARNTAPVLP